MKQVEVIGLDEAIVDFSRRYPALVDRARKSAISSAGYMIRMELRNHVEYGGTGWPRLHPLAAFRKKDKAGKWRRTTKRSPLEWLGKFARYIVNDRGDAVTIDFGRSRKGQAGSADKFLSTIARRHESGATVPVTAKTRLKMAMTAMGRKKKGDPGTGYFPLRKSTTSLQIPKRPSIGPVFRKISPRIGEHMRQKFFAAFERYLSGGAKK